MAARIVTGLQQAILEHRLPPGTKLSEDEIGEVYGVSRTIVRSALQSLAHDQLVTIEKHRGAFVARPTIREAHEVFEGRALIEPRVAAMAAFKIDSDSLKLLNAHMEAEHAAIAAEDKGRALALSGEFHLEIANIAAHDVFTDFVKSLVKRSSLIIALYWKRPDTTCESHSHHALIDALAQKNESEAEEIMRSHIVDLHSGLNLTPTNDASISVSQILGG
ncbi:MAG: GntR family transcriptional regulator [Pseudomonadota bacterium]